MREVFVEAVGEPAPEFEVLQPWRRTEDISAFRRIFRETGVEDAAVEKLRARCDAYILHCRIDTIVSATRIALARC